MTGRLIGSILLIIGCCFGGGVLTLPLVTTGLNTLTSISILLGAWLCMTLSAMLIVEVNINLPDSPNLIRMAKVTLGNTGVWLTWLCYLALFYTLLSAYLEGGTDLVGGLLQLVSWHLPEWMNTCIFLLIFLFVIYHGVLYIDWTNRILMFVKISSFITLLLLLIPTASISNLNFAENIRNPINGIMPIITSFGFAQMIPPLHTYLGSARAIKWATFLGSLFPIIAYSWWIIGIQSNLEHQHLLSIAQSHEAITDLASALAARLHAHGAGYIPRLFFAIAITTSFLAVSLSFIDFFMDAFRLDKHHEDTGFPLPIIALVFIPPLLVVLLNPGIFIAVIKFAGILCVLLLVLLPTLMAYSACYVKKFIVKKPFYCHRVILFANFMVSLFLLVLAAKSLF